MNNLKLMLFHSILWQFYKRLNRTWWLPGINSGGSGLAAKIDEGLGGILEICVLEMVLVIWINWQKVWKGMPTRTDWTARGFHLSKSDFQKEAGPSVSRVALEERCWKSKWNTGRSVCPGCTRPWARASAPQWKDKRTANSWTWTGGRTPASQTPHGWRNKWEHWVLTFKAETPEWKQLWQAVLM